MSRPERDADFISGYWYFYFNELIQYNTKENENYSIEVREDHIVFYDEKWDKWQRYNSSLLGTDSDCKSIFKAYIDWSIEKELLL